MDRTGKNNRQIWYITQPNLLNYPDCSPLSQFSPRHNYLERCPVKEDIETDYHIVLYYAIHSWSFLKGHGFKCEH